MRLCVVVLVFILIFFAYVWLDCEVEEDDETRL